MTNNNKIGVLIQDAIGGFRENPYWKGVYDNAPEGAKSYYRLMFAMTLLGTVAKDGQVDMASIGADEERDRIYHTMDDESWDYVLANAGHAEALGLHIARKKMQGKPDVKFGSWLS